MSMPAAPDRRRLQSRRDAAAFAVARRADGFVLILAMVVVPLPPFALDLLFTFNICFGLMILLADAVHGEADGFLVVPDLAADDNAAAAVAQRRRGARHPARRLSGHRRCWPGHRVVRHVRRRRQLRRRHRRLPHPRHHQLRRHHQGRRAHRRGRRALRPRRHAGQADGDRRRSQRRPDQPGGGDPPPPGGRAGSRFLRRDGRRQQVRARRRRRRGADPLHQPGRRADHRGLAARAQFLPRPARPTRC